MDLTQEDVEEILALLDSLPYDELDLRTPRFQLILRRTPDGWTQSTETRAAADPASHAGWLWQPSGYNRLVATTIRPEAGAGGPEAGAEGVAVVRSPLPGTFYRAPRPGAPPFVEAGSRVDADTVVGIVETMKLMNPVHAGTAGRVAEICAGNAEVIASDTVLVRIEPGAA